MKGRYSNSLPHWLDMLLDCEGLHATRMEVEEVNPLPKCPTKKPLSTKELSTKNTTYVTSPDTVVHAAYEDGMPYLRKYD